MTVKSVLCAVDVSHEDDIQVLETGEKIARLDGAQLDVITVVPNYGVTLVNSYFDENFQGEMVSKTKSALTELVSRVLGEERNKDVRHIVATGSVYEEILHAAKQAGADLIVIGAHKPHLKEFLLGPNAARVARHSECSVYIVRE
ncbi:nucleotide-binding universal stress UspA family protein [Labrenzia sp. EL_208]|uniref:universal stress protein n=1 Tax=Roseibium album TaxID=311410 RepID=UPI0018C963A7|nr:universal stress protein [Roseibium album]MBG6176179.1 nucleotide-binding universal stress UspA family protein [Labrenzia sp. EL_132]MBG6201108.1 nucleotide-binding universal stress UspA family protein [Labrenzia sp. EL_13]MBG6230794.1 nucleotide-binding universal stress UspA family protein [Labrenzia sp. EL_208]MCR9058157.1 universal stress protein [Paracoccaceae bacterium]